MTNSVYIHIPFCNNICSYCDFSKVYYNNDLVNKYLDSLFLEVRNNYQGEIINTLYIGGGSPSSLSIDNLNKLKDIIQMFKISSDIEFTIEVNPDDITKDKLLFYKEMGVNRISIGVESTINKYLKYLNRRHDFKLVQDKIKLIKDIGFSNISVDLIYGMKDETLHDLEKDLNNLLSLDINHISTYSLEIHDNTLLGINNDKKISDDLDRKMYDYIVNYLEKNGFEHYEISNFAKNKTYSKHNLVYWNNSNYYGFGIGASGYIDNIRYQNTKSFNNYFLGKRIINKEILSNEDTISYALILGFRKIKGINKNDFYNRYHVDILSLYNIKDLIKEGLLIDDGEYLKINKEYLYVENSILENFV